MFRIRPLITRIHSRQSLSITRCLTVHHGRRIGRPKGSTSTDEKFVTSDEYPLTSLLSNMLGPGGTMPSTATDKTPKPSLHIRPQIVSPSLCDDVLEYIGPTLEKHKGCDILDIQPGVCLWSQKIHEFLKPRSHVLLEPNPTIFKDFQAPLLNAPGSKYKLVSKDTTVIDSYRELIKEGIFPHQTRLGPEDADAQKPNDSLLVIGSLAWFPRLSGYGFDSMAKQVFHHFSAAAWSNDIFHAFGPVRTLFWVQADDFNSMVAPSLGSLKKAKFHLDMTQDIDMIVRPERVARPTGQGSDGREPNIQIESMVRALRVGREHGADPPPHRRDFTYDFAKHVEEVSGGNGRVSSRTMYNYIYNQQLAGTIPTGLVTASFVDRVQFQKQLTTEYPEITFSTILEEDDKRRRASTRLDKGHPGHARYSKCNRERAALAQTLRVRLRIEKLVDIGEELYLAECRAIETPEGPKKKALLEKVEQLDAAWEEGVTATEFNYKASVTSELDDRISLRYPPHPRLKWDNRPFEPLVMYEKEVWPIERMSLISATPRPKPAVGPADFNEWLHDFIYGLYADPGKSVTAALETMQPGLTEIIKDCPSLTDPKKGGRLQLKHLRVRMLTHEMVIKLAERYVSWPFKAPMADHSTYYRNMTERFKKPRPV